MSRWLALAAEALAAEHETTSSPAFVLVERGSYRIKAETSTDVKSASSRVLRLRMDLVDFDLPGLLQPVTCSTCRAPEEQALPADMHADRNVCAKDCEEPEAVAVAGSSELTASCSPQKSCANNSQPCAPVLDSLARTTPGQRLQNAHNISAKLRASPVWPPKLAVICAKHLCGAGTDLALHSLRRAVKSEGEMGNIAKINFATVLAPCCHHLCEWSAYVNQDFIAEVFHEIDAQDAFGMLTSITPWATEAVKLSSNDQGFCAATRERRRVLGLKAKRVLDIGRSLWLREFLQFKSVDLSVYTDSSTSPENLLILAKS